MYFQLKKLILWPRKAGMERRIVDFQVGRVNVITGASRTGKSAVIPIIDYCLGSGSCAIPVETIRKSCEAFGIVVSTSFGEILLARREPGNQKSTDHMMVLQAPVVEIPEFFKPNEVVPNVKRMLDEMAGLTNLDFSAGGSGSFDARPSFRDMAAFMFQPQNIVANRDVLFYKTETIEHRKKLRTVFPYVLNAITPDLMAKRYEADRVRLELRRKERELAEVQKVSDRWIAELRSKIDEARELGLIHENLDENPTRELMVDLLRNVTSASDVNLQVTSKTISEAVQEAMKLDEEERAASEQLANLKARYHEMTQLRESVQGYREAMLIQRDRLKVSDWLADQHDGTEECPICGNEMRRQEERLHELQQTLRAVEQTAGELKQIPAAFEREYAQTKERMDIASERLEAIRLRKRALEKRSKEAKEMQFRASRTARFIGSLDQALGFYDSLGTDSKLRTEVSLLKERLLQLDDDLRAGAIQRREASALAAVSNFAGQLLPLLDTEWPDLPISLSTSELSICVRAPERDSYLWEIGSGSNWLSYHLATTLALQRLFISFSHSPVPGMIIFDQPSQVYFPQRLAAKQTEVEEPDWEDEDVRAVQKAFAAMARTVTEAKGHLQVIVLDHAASNVWGAQPNVVEAADWHGGEKLVPDAWR